jgi:hypothetical protein
MIGGENSSSEDSLIEAYSEAFRKKEGTIPNPLSVDA